MACNSGTTWMNVLIWDKLLLKNATGWPFWIKTTPIPIPETSVCTKNGFENLEVVK